MSVLAGLCPYELLGVEPTATSKQIKTAYRKRALRCHPDRLAQQRARGDLDAAAAAAATLEFQRLSAAHALLSDPDRRAGYDADGDVDDEEAGGGFAGRGAAADAAGGWGAYFRNQFPELTVERIDAFAAECVAAPLLAPPALLPPPAYCHTHHLTSPPPPPRRYRASAEETADVVRAFVESEGDMDLVIDTVMCCTEADRPRFEAVVRAAVAAGDAEPLGALFAAGAAKPARKKKKAAKRGRGAAGDEAAEAEAALAAIMAKRGGGGGGGGALSLVGRGAASRFDDMLAGMEARYATADEASSSSSGKKKAKSKSKKSKR